MYRNNKNIFKNYKIKFVCLLTTEEDLIKRDKERSKNCQMGNRCLILLNNFKNKNFDSANLLNTHNLSILEVVDEIEKEDKYIL